MYTWQKRLKDNVSPLSLQTPFTSTIIDWAPAPPAEVTELALLVHIITRQRGLQELVSVDDFISPEGEAVFDDTEALEEQILDDTAQSFDDDNDKIKDAEGLDKDIDFTKVLLDDVI